MCSTTGHVLFKYNLLVVEKSFSDNKMLYIQYITLPNVPHVYYMCHTHVKHVWCFRCITHVIYTPVLFKDDLLVIQWSKLIKRIQETLVNFTPPPKSMRFLAEKYLIFHELEYTNVNVLKLLQINNMHNSVKE